MNYYPFRHRVCTPSLRSSGSALSLSEQLLRCINLVKILCLEWEIHINEPLWYIYTNYNCNTVESGF